MTTSADAHIETGGMESVASTVAVPEQQSGPPKPKNKSARPMTADKMMKRIEVLQGKVEKLLVENKELKKQHKILKSSMSRIHKIPKKVQT